MKKVMMATYIIMFLMVVGLASAAATITINCPAESDYVKGVITGSHCEGKTNQNLNITITGTDSANNITNITFYYTPSGGSLTLIGYNSSTALSTTEATMNESLNVGGYSLGWNTQGLMDKTTYTLTVYGGNRSSNPTSGNGNFSAIATATRTFFVDNSVPTAALSTTQTSSSTVKPKDTWTYNTINASSCTLYFDSNAYTGLIGGTNGAETCTFSGPVPEYTYTSVYATSSDGLNTTTTTTLSSIKVDAQTSGGGMVVGLGGGGSSAAQSAAALQAITGGEQSTSTTTGGVNPIILFGIAIAALIFWKDIKKAVFK